MLPMLGTYTFRSCTVVRVDQLVDLPSSVSHTNFATQNSHLIRLIIQHCVLQDFLTGSANLSDPNRYNHGTIRAALLLWDGTNICTVRNAFRGCFLTMQASRVISRTRATFKSVLTGGYLMLTARGTSKTEKLL